MKVARIPLEDTVLLDDIAVGLPFVYASSREGDIYMKTLLVPSDQFRNLQSDIRVPVVNLRTGNTAFVDVSSCVVRVNVVVQEVRE